MSVASVNEYISNLDENAKKEVSDFESFMKTEFPQIISKISYSIPMWWVGPKIYDGYVAVSAAKKHYSIHFLDENYISALKTLLPNCTFGKRCINIKYGDEYAISVVKQKVSQYLNSLLKA